MKTVIKVNPRKGRGVFAAQNIGKGKVIEVCELIILDMDEVGPELQRYIYLFKKKKAAVALGNGSLYNHGDSPNAEYSFDYDKKLLTMASIRPITKGEEITIDYDYEEEDRKRFNIG